MSFFAQLETSFKDVSTQPGIDTTQFLSASEGLVKLFDLLGSTAFKVVQSDLTGNITKIKARQAAAPGQSATLEDLVENEVATDKKRPATQALLWLNRGLQFTALALRRTLNDEKEELSTAFTKAYEGSLRQYHSFVIRPVFALAMKACPYRADFFEKLGAPPSELEEWLSGLEKVVAQNQTILTPEVTKGL